MKAILLALALLGEPMPSDHRRPTCYEIPTFAFDSTRPDAHLVRVPGERVMCSWKRPPPIKRGWR